MDDRRQQQAMFGAGKLAIAEAKHRPRRHADHIARAFEDHLTGKLRLMP